MVLKIIDQLLKEKEDFSEVWREEYSCDEGLGRAKLFTLIVNVGGHDAEITKEMVENEEEQHIARRVIYAAIQEAHPTKSLLEKTGKNHKQLRKYYIDFVVSLAGYCSRDEASGLFSHLCTFLSLLSKASIHPLRYSATLTACKLINALSKITVALECDINTIKRKQSIESRKGHEESSSKLITIIRDNEQVRHRVERQIRCIYDTILRKRMRDTNDGIRSICLEEVAIAVRQGANYLRNGNVLKEISYALYAPDVNGRLSAIKATEILLPCEIDDSDLTAFKQKAAKTLLSLRNDIDSSVVRAAVNCLQILFRNGSFSEEEEQRVFWLMCGVDHKVAVLAGNCFVESVRRGVSGEWHVQGLKKLCKYILDTKSSEYIRYFVDSLFENHRMLKDWRCMAEELVENVLTQKEKVILSIVLKMCVEKAVTGVRHERDSTKPWHTSTPLDALPNLEEEHLTAKKREMSQYFIGAMSDLLETNYVDKEILANLINVCSHFDMDMYFSLRKEQKLFSLLDFLESEVNETDNAEVVFAAANALQKMSRDEAMTSSYAKTKVECILEKLQHPFFELLDAFLTCKTGDEAFEGVKLKQLQLLLSKFYIFSQYLMIPDSVLEVMFRIVTTESVWEDLGPQSIMEVLQGCKSAICCKIVAFKKTPENESLASRVEEVAIMQKQLIEGLKQFLPDSLLTKQVLMLLFDCLILFSSSIGRRADLQPLVVEIDSMTKHQLERTLTDLLSVTPGTEPERRENVSLLYKYIQLVLYGDLQYTDAAFILQFIQVKEFRPLISDFLKELKKNNKSDICSMLMTSLSVKFGAAREDGRVSSEELSEMKVIAKLLAQSIAVTPENRTIITDMHKAGISLASAGYEPHSQVAPKNIQFLDVLIEFVGKVMKMDRQYLVKYFDRRFKVGQPVNRWEGWKPLISYRNALIGRKSTKKDLDSE